MLVLDQFKAKAIELEYLDADNHILQITLNRPEASNAFSDEMIDELCHSLMLADQDDNVRVIVVTGAGKHFCAGGDVKAMLGKQGMFAGDSNALRRKYKYGIQDIPRTMEFIETPVIAVINGAAIGAGLDFACMCDVRISSKRAKFGETFVKLGLIPGDGGAFFLQRVIGYAKAMELTLTAEVFGAEKAKDIGLISDFYDDGELMTNATAMAQKISSNAPVAVSLAKKAIRQAYGDSAERHLEIAAAYQGIAQRTQDHFEGISAIIEKREPQFRAE